MNVTEEWHLTTGLGRRVFVYDRVDSTNTLALLRTGDAFATGHPHDFDMAEGVTYDLDITRPFGQRIQNLKFKGQPVAPAQKLRVVTNNYRVNGGGGYTMYKGAPVVYRSSAEVRELIIDWVEKNKTIPIQANNNWRIVGAQ